MSTRCQVKVIGEGINPDELTLYHHTDGYPEYMIPLLTKAHGYEHPDGYDMSWTKERAGKVASLLCWADPAVFEPESSHELHGDIEFYYKLYCGKSEEWEIEILDPDESMKVVEPRTPLSELLLKYHQ